MSLDSTGNIYVADSNNYTIRKVTPAGDVSTLAGLAGTPGSTEGSGNAARFSFPRTWPSTRGHGLRRGLQQQHDPRMTPAGDVSTLAGLAGSTGSVDGPRVSGTVFVSARRGGGHRGQRLCGGHRQQYDPENHAGGIVTTLAGLAGTSGSTDGTGSAARFDGPYGLAADTAGNVYVADISNSTIRKITPAGVVTTLAGLAGSFGSADGTGSAARFDFPASVAVADAERPPARAGGKPSARFAASTPARRPAQDRRRSFPSPRRSCPSRRRCRQKCRPWW